MFVYKFKIYHKKFLKTDLNDDEIKKMAKKFSNLVIEKVITAPYVKGAREFILKYNKDYNLFISTGTPIDEIKRILTHNNVIRISTEKKNSN